MTSSSEVIKSVSFKAWAAVAEGIHSRMRQIKELSDEAVTMAASIGIYSHPFRAVVRAEGMEVDPTDERVEREMRRMMWREIAAKAGLMAMLDRQGREDFEKSVDKDPPPFTEAVVLATFETLANQRGEIMYRGVINAVKGLAWDWKTNSPYKLGKRAVIRLGTKYGARDIPSPDYRLAAQVDDLIRCFAKLDGKPEPVGLMESFFAKRFKERMFDGTRRDWNEYASIKLFRNGNGHVLFLRPDLVDAVNRIVADRHPHAIAPDPVAEGRRKAS